MSPEQRREAVDWGFWLICFSASLEAADGGAFSSSLGVVWHKSILQADADADADAAVILPDTKSFTVFNPSLESDYRNQNLYILKPDSFEKHARQNIII